MLEREGLVAGRARGALQAREASESFGGAEKLRLLQARNPRGALEWKGPWPDKSSKWKKCPNVKKQLKVVDADDGAFWASLALDDFKKACARVSACDRATLKDASLDASESNGSCGAAKGWRCGRANSWLLCKGARSLCCARGAAKEALGAKERGFCCCA